MWGFPYDDLSGWRGPYPPDIFAAQFEKIAQGWQPGLAEMEIAVAAAPETLRAQAAADLRLAQAAAIHFQSVANQARFVAARDIIADTTATRSPSELDTLRGEMVRSLESEIALSRELYTLVQQDSRIGFEPSCQYFYLPLDLVEKVVNCRWLLERLKD
jgi:hypothetical protein